MADPQPPLATDELIRGILRSVDPTVPANADEFGKVALAALEKVNADANEIAEKHLPQVSNTLAEHVGNMVAVSQAILKYHDNVVAMAAAERFNAARAGHTTAVGFSKMSEEQRIKARNVELEVDRQIALLVSTRAAVGEFITSGCGIVAAQTGTEPPAPDSYIGRLSSRVRDLQTAFTQAAAIQKTLNDRKKTLASGLGMLGDIATGVAAVDADFLKLMNPPAPPVAQTEPEQPAEQPPEHHDDAGTTKPADGADEESIAPAPSNSGVPDAAQLADVILAAQAKRTDPSVSTSTALMVIPQPP